MKVLVVLAISGAIVSQWTGARAEGGCTAFDESTGGCTTSSGSINGGGVDVGASRDANGSTSADDGGVSVGDGSGDAAPIDPAALRYATTCVTVEQCGTQTIHLSDLISFHPPVPDAAMEPNGWAVIHLASNFTAAAAQDVQTGTLLGLPAEVRFTPKAFTWDYGDGSTRRSADGGSTWRRLGVPEFTPTGTSHVYEARGTFTVRIGVVYGAEYRFGGQAWQNITGSLNVAAPSFDVVVGDAKTVLVGGDCTTDPAGPGC